MTTSTYPDTRRTGRRSRRLRSSLTAAGVLLVLLLPPLAATGAASPSAAGGAGCLPALGVTDRWFPLPPPEQPQRHSLYAGVFDGDPCSYLAADETGKVFVTHDSGAHWSTSTTSIGPPGDAVACFATVNGVYTQDLPAGNGYVFGIPADAATCPRTSAPSGTSVLPSGLYLAGDYGRTLTPVAAFDGLSVERIAVSQADPRVRYALATGDPTHAGLTVFVSTDGGTSWNVSATGAATSPTGPIAVGGTSGSGVWLAGSADGAPSASTPNQVGDANLWTSSDGGTTYSDIDHERQIFAIATGLTSTRSVRLDLGTNLGVAVGTGGSAFLQTGGGQASALALEATNASVLMAIRSGVPVRSPDDGRTFLGTPGLGNVGLCAQTLSRDAERPSLFVLSLRPQAGNPLGPCQSPGIWMYRSSGKDLTGNVVVPQPPPPPTGSNGSNDVFCSHAGGAGPVFGPGSTPDPSGLVVYVGQGECIWAFDALGRGHVVATVPVCRDWSEGIAFGFDDRLVVTCRTSHVLASVDVKTGQSFVIDDTRGDVEGPSFDRYGDLFVVDNDPASQGGSNNTVYEYPYPQHAHETPTKVYSFGPNEFTEDTRIAPPGSPYAGTLLVLYAADDAATQGHTVSTDAIAMFRPTARGWKRIQDFAHEPWGFVSIGMAFTPNGSVVLAADDGSGRLLEYSPDGRAYHYLASLAPTSGLAVPGQTTEYGASYVFAKMDITAKGLIVATSSTSSGWGGDGNDSATTRNAVVRVAASGTQLTPDFGTGFNDGSSILGVATANVITGLPRLPLPGHPRMPPQRATPVVATDAPPPGPPGTGPTVPVSGPAAAPAPGPAPAPQAQADPLGQPVAQGQVQGQPGLVAQRQTQPQLALALQQQLQTEANEHAMTARRHDPTLDVVLCAGLLTLGAVAYGAARATQRATARAGGGRDSARSNPAERERR